MIGVIPKAGQVRIVEEFFELFKTPWEFYRPGRIYDVVINTSDEVQEVNTRLLLIYGAAKKDIDARIGIAVNARQQGALLSDLKAAIPIYSELGTFATGGAGEPCARSGSAIAGIRIKQSDCTVIRLGYDLFDEVECLLSAGQSVEHASIPTLDIHIRMLREWILGAGIPLIEIPPTPGHYRFAVCLTHDIDFVGIRNHQFDHSMLGFVYRATLGGLRNFIRGRLSAARLLRGWLAVASLPLVYAGWLKDFWEPFEWYRKVEKGLFPTYFLIPFKRRPGDKVPGRHAARRATAYDVSDVRESAAVLQREGCELGVHGIDAWHNADKGREELGALTAVASECSGIRMHWLLRDASTPGELERAGYQYDSTFGYNETVGYRAGTGQVFRPQGAKTLLELPMHIQDGALFYPQRLDLTEAEAEQHCQVLVDNAQNFGGALTVLWHDRSHGPERFWGDFYAGLVQRLKSLDCWFANAGHVVNWFRKRREIAFESVEQRGGMGLRYDGERIQPPVKISFYTPSSASNGSDGGGDAASERIDIFWDGQSHAELETQMNAWFSQRHRSIASYSHS